GVICKILILRGVWVFFVVRSVPGSGDFWEGSGTPRDGRRGKLKHGRIRIFSRISTTGNGVVKKARACAPEAA
ncbi:hypothetical protein, partial [Klebsiella grimontii]|uniref:hypothetical protein n=1 Tax=Klebsiella grimontii TaxID=2058152 RepID=UPI001CA3797C